MSLTPESLRRLDQLAAVPSLTPMERGELQAMARKYTTPAERVRIGALLAPAPTDATPEAYKRGVQRGEAHRPIRNR